MFQKRSNLIVISRGIAVLKNDQYFFQYLDGRYIDEIAEHFNKVLILCPIIRDNDSAVKPYIGYDYQFKSQNIAFSQLIDDKKLNRGVIFNLCKLIIQFFRIKQSVKKYDVVFVFMATFRAVMGIYFASRFNKKCILYSGNNWKEDALLAYRWNSGILKYGKYFYAFVCGLMERWAMKHTPIRLVNGYKLRKKYGMFPGLTQQTVPLIHLESKDFYYKEPNPKKEIKLISVGAVIPRKGYEYLIEAIKLAEEKLYIKYELNIVGALRGDAYEATLRSMIKEHNFEHKVIFRGYIGNRRILFKMYRDADIFVLPTINEGFPRVIWEAISQGLPVLASNIYNIEKEFEGEKDVIMLAECKNPKSFANQILKFSRSSALRDKFAQNGQRFVRELLYNNSSSSQFIKVLKGYYGDV